MIATRRRPNGKMTKRETESRNGRDNHPSTLLYSILF